MSIDPRCSSIVSRLVKDVVCMTSNTLASEHGREAQTFSNLVFRYQIVSAFRLANDEFADL
jgi:hypothetical protein